MIFFADSRTSATFRLRLTEIVGRIQRPARQCWSTQAWKRRRGTPWMLAASRTRNGAAGPAGPASRCVIFPVLFRVQAFALRKIGAFPGMRSDRTFVWARIFVYLFPVAVFQMPKSSGRSSRRLGTARHFVYGFGNRAGRILEPKTCVNFGNPTNQRCDEFVPWVCEKRENLAHPGLRPMASYARFPAE